MNTNRDVMSGSDFQMPSGCEVGAATFHTPVSGVQPIHSSGISTSDLRTKLEDLRSRSMTKLHDVQQKVTTESAIMKREMQQKLMTTKHDLQTKLMTTRSSMQRNLTDQMMKMQSSMRTSPAKWAGIAAGSGFAIGMIGRFMHWRNQHHRHMPQLVIIESTC